ncbi:hypothetical protein HQ45_00445 [Porphyromonas crevioricanis]|nr:hypothetical protein HQ45_00445 [Porphyromonas crevioricanis]
MLRKAVVAPPTSPYFSKVSIKINKIIQLKRPLLFCILYKFALREMIKLWDYRFWGEFLEGVVTTFLRALGCLCLGTLQRVVV